MIMIIMMMLMMVIIIIIRRNIYRDNVKISVKINNC